MKAKFFLAAMAVAFSFSVISCSGNKSANSAASTDSVAVEAPAECAKADSCCKSDSTCTKSAECDKAACDKKEACAEKKACCDKK